MTVVLPPIDFISNLSIPAALVDLEDTLIILLEASPEINGFLVPAVAKRLHEVKGPIEYQDIIDISLGVVSEWDHNLQAHFIEGHPRVGEVKKLSHLSSKEQATIETPPEVLARLAHLNACYEYRYPGLRYITFVNGRSRTMIMEEMEDKLDLPRSLSPDAPKTETLEKVPAGSIEWLRELKRAIDDIGRIASARLKALEGNGNRS